jgi:hypothetical protein
LLLFLESQLMLHILPLNTHGGTQAKELEISTTFSIRKQVEMTYGVRDDVFA